MCVDANSCLLRSVPKLLTLIGAKVLFDDKMSATNMLGFLISQVALGAFAHQRNQGPKNLLLPK